jgi:hypothetical protein
MSQAKARECAALTRLISSSSSTNAFARWTSGCRTGPSQVHSTKSLRAALSRTRPPIMPAAAANSHFYPNLFLDFYGVVI